MRLTLEQLKAADTKTLSKMWWEGNFPFDSVVSCHMCLAAHAIVSKCTKEHEQIVFNAKGLLPVSLYESRERLDAALEKYYALRLFYDSLYPSSVEPVPETPAEVKESASEQVSQEASCH